MRVLRRRCHPRHVDAGGADKRLPDCEGIETQFCSSVPQNSAEPTRGCPTVRVLRPDRVAPASMYAGPDKRLPDCEGIETIATRPTRGRRSSPTRGCPTVRVLRHTRTAFFEALAPSRQEAARL